MSTKDNANSVKIAALNDALRQRGVGGKIMITAGIQALGRKAVDKIIAQIRTFDAFTDDNDPYRERDFGSVVFENNKIFWKMDAYDRNLEYGSPDPTNPALTVRVMTIMLAQEY